MSFLSKVFGLAVLTIAPVLNKEPGLSPNGPRKTRTRTGIVYVEETSLFRERHCACLRKALRRKKPKRVPGSGIFPIACETSPTSAMKKQHSLRVFLRDLQSSAFSLRDSAGKQRRELESAEFR